MRLKRNECNKETKANKSQGNQHNTYCDRSKTTGRCGIVHLPELPESKRCKRTCEIKFRIVTTKAAYNKKKDAVATNWAEI